MRWIYISPHLDDAVFSAGGLIYEQSQTGLPVEIWTLMCGYAPEENVSPFAQAIHAQWGFSSAEETTRQRRAEDQKAGAILGARTVHFDFWDCIYRRAANGEWLYWDVFLSPHPEDAELPARIAQAISARLQPDDVLVCQLAVGSHVDHVLVRQALELLGTPLRYDIDIPYIFYQPQHLEPKSAGMKESVHSITDAGLKHWQKAALEYKSQLAGLGDAFDTPDKVQAALRAYWAERIGIRLFVKD
jgi:LmbE family N-acetylglucosaminyl deacetylase